MRFSGRTISHDGHGSNVVSSMKKVREILIGLSPSTATSIGLGVLYAQPSSHFHLCIENVFIGNTDKDDLASENARTNPIEAAANQ